jgi:outer membrane protein
MNGSLIGLQLSIPLYTGGLRSAKHDEAVALADKARFDVEATRKAVSQRTRTAWLSVASGLYRIRARERALESSRARLDATEIGHEVGARTTLDLLNAQADHFRAERELAQAKYQLVLDRLALLQASGELSEVDLRAANANFSR